MWRDSKPDAGTRPPPYIAKEGKVRKEKKEHIVPKDFRMVSAVTGFAFCGHSVFRVPPRECEYFESCHEILTGLCKHENGRYCEREV
jgi:hypothetical protein